MGHERIHRAVSDDGTEIAGRVDGQGPPLVLVHGAFEDGDTCWEALLPWLRERFTCYAMSLRGRGLSGHSADLSTERLVRDVTAFVDSIGEPVGLVGESGGGFLALGAAGRTPRVSAVAVYEPIVLEVQSQEDAARFEETFARVSTMAGEGRLADAVGAFAELLANDDELAALSASADGVEALAANVPVQVQEFTQLLERQHGAEAEGPSPTAPSALPRVTVPVLLLYGAQTALGTWITDGVRHVADHVADPHVREIDRAGHFAPALRPEPIADELARFFQTAHQPA